MVRFGTYPAENGRQQIAGTKSSIFLHADHRALQKALITFPKSLPIWLQSAAADYTSIRLSKLASWVACGVTRSCTSADHGSHLAIEEFFCDVHLPIFNIIDGDSEIPQSLSEESIVKAWSRPTRRHPSGQYGARSIDGSMIRGELKFVPEE